MIMALPGLFSYLFFYITNSVDPIQTYTQRLIIAWRGLNYDIYMYNIIISSDLTAATLMEMP